MTAQFYALLVGIDRYENPTQAPHLRGCIADVEGTYNWLTEQMGFPKENVLLLTSHMDQREPPELRATRANILRGWQEHLMQAKEGDQVFFNFSGHGAQARSIASENISGYDETLVPCDSRTPGIFDILDKELARLIDAVERNGAQVTVFLDCCHSGSGTRMAPPQGENAPRVRKGTIDERERPVDTLVSGTVVSGTVVSGTRSAKAARKWNPRGNHLLLAGCRDEELSHEYQAPETGQWQGATTYFFHKAMANYGPDMTWADVHDYVQIHVNKIYPRQSPQLEGPNNLHIFGGLGARRPGYLLVTDVDGELFIKLNAGVTAGLSEGTKVALYPPESDLAGLPAATGVVKQVKVDHAWAKLDAPTAIVLASRAKILSYRIDSQHLRIALGDDLLQQSISASSSNFLEVISPEETNSVATYYVLPEDGRYVIRDASGEQVVNEMPAADAAGADQIKRMLEHLAIYNNVVTLQNPASSAAMRGAISIESLSTYTRLGANREPRDPTPLRTGDGNNDAVITAGENLFFKVCNRTNQQLYLAIFELTPNFGVKLIYPRRASYQRVAGRKEIALDRRDMRLTNPKLNRGRTIFKVIASKEPVNFSVLSLPNLNVERSHIPTRAGAGSTLGKLLNAARFDGTRALRLSVNDDDDDRWTTAQVSVTIVQKSEQS